MLLKLLAVLLTGVFDRFRGDDDLGLQNTADAAIMGALLLFIMGELSTSWASLFFMLSVAGALAPGYGGPWGAVIDNRPMIYDEKPSRWQKGILRENEFLALLVRGLIGAAILAPSCYVINNYAPM